MHLSYGYIDMSNRRCIYGAILIKLTIFAIFWGACAPYTQGSFAPVCACEGIKRQRGAGGQRHPCCAGSGEDEEGLEPGQGGIWELILPPAGVGTDRDEVGEVGVSSK